MALSEEIAKIVNFPITLPETKHFSDGETYINIKNEVVGEHVFIVQSGSPGPNDAFFEMLQLIHASKRMGAEHITAVFPFFPYRRQERVVELGECISAQLVAELTEKAGAASVILANIHTPHIESFFSVPVTNIELWDVYDTALSDLQITPETHCVVAPDAGSVEDSSIIAKKLNIPLVLAEKHRPSHEVVEITSIAGEIKDRHVVMVDDEVNTAGTVCAVSSALKKHGAQDQILLATHAVFSGDSLKRISNSDLSSIITTDTITHTDTLPEKITTLSAAQPLADAIKLELTN